MVAMATTQAVFRVVLRMQMDQQPVDYLLTFRLGSHVESKVELSRVTATLDMTKPLDFEPFSVDVFNPMYFYSTAIELVSVQGEVAVTVVFAKRAADGAIRVSLPVVCYLSPTSGFQAEFIPMPFQYDPRARRDTRETHEFTERLRDALASPVCWNSFVERPRETLQPLRPHQLGVFTLKGAVRGGDHGADWMVPIVVDVEFLADGSLVGVCIGEAFCSSVTGRWTRSTMVLTMEFRRSADDALHRIHLDGSGILRRGYMGEWRNDGEQDVLYHIFELKPWKLRQGITAANRVSIPFSFYQDARLALISTRQVAGLPNEIWSRIFSFYEASSFVRCDPRRPVLRCSELTDDASEVPGTPAELPAAERDPSDNTLPGLGLVLTRAGVVAFLCANWAAVVYVVVSMAVIKWMIDVRSCGVIQSEFPSYCAQQPDADWRVFTTAYCGVGTNGSTVHWLPSRCSEAVGQWTWPIVVVAMVISFGFALVPRTNARMLFAMLVASGFVCVRLVGQTRSFGAMDELFGELVALLVVSNSLFLAAPVRTLASWMALPVRPKVFLWGVCYVVPFFISINVHKIRDVANPTIVDCFDWITTIRDDQDAKPAVATYVVVAELVLVILFGGFRLMQELYRLCLLRRIALYGIAVVAGALFSLKFLDLSDLLAHRTLLGALVFLLTRYPSPLTATVQSALVGCFVRVYASYRYQAPAAAS